MNKRAMSASPFCYHRFTFAYNAKPTVPSASPATEAPHEKKFKKNVDSRMCMTIKNGITTPNNIMPTAIVIKRPG